MREIKFKAKRVDNGEWVEGYYLLNETTKIVVSQTWDSWLTYEVIPETISQYTGLKDKLGNEIYENDIVKFDSIETFIVKYDYTSFKLEQIDKQYCDEMSMFYHRIPTMFEVIGNVFDKEV